MFENIGNKETRPVKNHKGDAPANASKEASKKYREKNYVLSVPLPPEYKDFLRDKANGALVKKSVAQVFLEYMEESMLAFDFEQWKKEQDEK